MTEAPCREAGAFVVLSSDTAPMLLALVIVGFLMEAAGIALAVQEVNDRRKRVRAYQTRKQVVFGSGAAETSVVAFGMGAVVGGDPPTLEQRIEALEAGTTAMRAEIKEAARQAEKKAKDAADALVRDVRHAIEQDVNGVREFLLDVTKPTRALWASLALLFSGLLLQSVANVLSVQAQ